MREWLERKNWYWYSFTITITPFPWHWQTEWTNYGWGYVWKFGPIGVSIIKPLGGK